MIDFALSILGSQPLGECILGVYPLVDEAPSAPVNQIGEFVGWLRGHLGRDVHPNRLPQKANLPLLSYAIVDSSTEMQLSGATRLRRWQIQFDAWAGDPTTSSRMQEDLFDLLGTYRGPVGRAILQVAIPGRVMTSFEPSVTKGDGGYFRAMCEWRVTIFG